MSKITKEVFYGEKRPHDQEKVIYFFEPFNTWFVGIYHQEGDSVSSRSGFTTWQPEVTMWMKNEPL